ncbi:MULTISPECIES: TRAP transporter permease [Hyphomicrobiales]|jgi:TRAP transporter 4TM/12TM fusion protein|uniref:TRAP transporter permease n=1 Tax=Bosea massiliensis TaxID=151419 RepID=A0ABW0P6S1_9HYPH|nr:MULTISPECIES: TRAP transporter fused permease subunit [Hyphomicrobiales]
MLALLKLIAPGRSRQLGTPEQWTVHVIGVSAAVLLIAISFGWYIKREIALFLFLGAVLSLAFLTTTANPLRPTGRSTPSWCLVALSLGSCGYFVWMQPVHEMRLPMIDELSTADIAASIVLIALVMEATRRCIGMILVVLVATFLAYAIFGNRLTGSFAHRGFSTQEIVDHLVFSTNGLFGPALEVAAFLVVVFVVFGALLDRIGGADFFYDIANSLVGKQVGGASKVAVVSSGLYGSISGSPTADVVTTGSFSIPLMIRTGTSRTYAGAIESAASTGGALLPPVMGSAAFLMTDFTGIPYATIALSALIPALLYYQSVFLAAHFKAHRDGLQPMSEGETPSILAVLRRDWAYLVPIGLLVWGVLSLNRPAFAGALACAALVPVAVLRHPDPVRLVKTLFFGLSDGMRGMIGVGVACAIAGLVVGTLSMTDLTGKISSGLFHMSGGSPILTILVSAFVIIVLGMGMPTPAVYALSAVLAAPALIALGVAVLPAHLFIVYIASMSAITPPVAVAAFAAASIAKANPVLIAVVACRIAMVAFLLPFVFMYQPALLLIGSPAQILISVGTAILGVLALNAAIEGYFMIRLDGLKRVLLFLAGVGLFLPIPSTEIAGALLLSATTAWLWSTRRSAPRARPA